MTEEICVTQALPNHGQVVMCYGNKTFCCKEDMDEPDWHHVRFEFIISAFKLKKNLPSDPEESILEYCKCIENWAIHPENDLNEHVIGVTKWKKIS